MKFETIKPTFYDEFSCLGSECNYSCCQEWKIGVSKCEYELIQKLKCSTGEFENVINNTFVINEGAKSDAEYAKIIYDDKKRCPCLNDEGLCALQLNCGFDALPEVCRIFPRMAYKFKDNFELTLTPACERVVELLTKEKDGIVLKTGNINLNHILLNGEINNNDTNKRPALSYYFDIKILGLGILMNKSYTIEERMVILGLAMDKINCYEQESKLFEIPMYVDTFLENIEGGSFKESFSSFSTNETMKVFNNLLYSEMFFNSGRKYDILKGITDKIDAIQKDKDCDIKFNANYDVEKYNKCLNNYKAFMKDREYYMENITVAYYLSTFQPFYKKDKSVLDNYLFFSVLFSIYKFLLSIYLDEDSTDKDFVYFTALFTRATIHNENVFENIIKTMEKNKNNTVAYIAALIM